MPPHPPEFTDTDPRAMEVWLDLIRRMPAGDKLAAVLELTAIANGTRRRMATLAEGFIKLLEALDKLEIPYSIGGSVASSVHGIPRTTMDVDVIADLNLERVDELAEILQPEFYADRLTMRDALNRGRSFNLIHIASAYKFDIFPLQSDEYSRTEFNRRSFTEIRSLGPEPIECMVDSAEDTVLRKLEWYRAGGESSERQWNDLRGILQVSGEKLDRAYLSKWAKFLKVDDLLARLLP